MNVSIFVEHFELKYTDMNKKDSSNKIILPQKAFSDFYTAIVIK